jgi:Rps23 Pro-64 3,4-dihydroxylase Tpa1-like proline 4-hydroxylase
MNAPAAAASPTVAFAPHVRADLVAGVFRASGRVHIGGLLAQDAALRLHQSLTHEVPWQEVTGDAEGHHELPAAGDPDSAKTRDALLSSAEREAGLGFAYRYRNFAMLDHYQDGRHKELYVMRLLEFLNSGPFIDFARLATGCHAIRFADAQATLFGPGDFLTCHDDEVQGKQRHAAYVLSLTPQWRPDWGGLLAFPDQGGHLHEAFCPAFNALNLLRVPTPHLVTQVASFARAGRYSVTGWLRG